MATACLPAQLQCTLRAFGKQGHAPNPHMLDHLLDFDPEIAPAGEGPVTVEKHSPEQVLDAQISTTDWLKTLGAEDTEAIATKAEQQAARQAFNSVVTAAPDEQNHHQLAQIKTPEAVRHLVGMLTAYDWEFVQQAKEIRGYTVSQLLEETKSSNANIRLKALIALGKVTEVGLFTEKIEVKKTDLTEEGIDKKLKEKLAKFMDIEDAEPIDIEVKETPTPDERAPDA